MSNHLSDNPRPSCSFCRNYATAECDCWDRKLFQICGAMVCHQHRTKVDGLDYCPRHAPHNRAAHPVNAGHPQQASFKF